ncbi:hypothetical protein DDK07_08175 [Mycobacteroides abscessus]|nr:hypothetical protein DDT48_12200 [Mycobacteroides abscessus]EIU36189.1 hypothetical protein MA6G0125S_3632 [Mycobacteroides abscessus 6G-0125-S]EIU38835.1 hypothetical protein MA6G0125R_2590 [Mycobacteroides abscessus 6G-0125-R]EIU53094.1 hypothetical protein MA6G0728S_3315 [Mycobacteroides abscessus 6G-0728-S]EIU55218.1 hypothetical protein MA6G1108_3557 [Mycobacteroides abscessus 6G-1108]EIU88661.1 hypothetical protein MA6G0212_3618 [Mycobacteroides abscessus 6G-0212]EIU94750.1 hypotheti
MGVAPRESTFSRSLLAQWMFGSFGRFVGFRVVHYAGIAATAGPTIAARGTADIGPTSPWL